MYLGGRCHRCSCCAFLPKWKSIYQLAPSRTAALSPGRSSLTSHSSCPELKERVGLPRSCHWTFSWRGKHLPSAPHPSLTVEGDTDFSFPSPDCRRSASDYPSSFRVTRLPILSRAQRAWRNRQFAKMPSTKFAKKAEAAKKLPPINRRRPIRVKSIELGEPVAPGTEDGSADLSEEIATSLNLGSSDEVSPDRRSVESTVHVATDFPPKPAWHKSSHKAPKHETHITTPAKSTRKDGSKASGGQTIGHKRVGSDLGVPLGVPAKRKRDSPLTHA